MSKAQVAAIGVLTVFLAACSGGRPSKAQRQAAFVAYMKEEGNDNAKIRDFQSNKCTSSECAPTYACDVSARVEAVGRDFDHELDGIYAFAEIGGEWKVTGRIQ